MKNQKRRRTITGEAVRTQAVSLQAAADVRTNCILALYSPRNSAAVVERAFGAFVDVLASFLVLIQDETVEIGAKAAGFVRNHRAEV